MNDERFDPELDDLLSDLHRLLDDEDGQETPVDCPAEEPDDALADLLDLGEEQTPMAPEEQAEFDRTFDERFASLGLKTQEVAAKIQELADQKAREAALRGEEELEDLFPKKEEQSPAEAPVEEPPAQPKTLWDNVPKDLPMDQTIRWTERQRVPKHVAKLQQNQDQAYADWLYAQDRRDQEAPPPPGSLSDEELLPPKKKHHVVRNLLLTLVLVTVALAAAAVFFLPRQPVSDYALSTRRSGVSTILVAGTDASGARTDALLLVSVDRGRRQISLVSIPRDTLVPGSYDVPKINGVYAVNGGGAEGMDMLLTRVQQCIGFRPDGCLLVSLTAFEELVDAMGGVSFQVPTDMFYNDPSQDLYIALQAGKQTLSGEQAMGLMRFRAGYADADLTRIQVQRQFLGTLVDQLLSAEGVLKSPQLLDILLDHTQTDLTARNLMWLAETALLAGTGDLQSATLPGTPATIGGGSYYILDGEKVANLVNEMLNPYDRDVTVSDLEIRTN